MKLTYLISQIPRQDRAACLAWGTRDGNLLTLDTTDPRYGMRPPEPIPADTTPEQERRRAQAGGCCGEPARVPD